MKELAHLIPSGIEAVPHGNEIIFNRPLSYGLTVFAIAATIFVISRVCPKEWKKARIFTLAFSLVMLFLLPTIILERITVYHNGFDARLGFFGTTSVHSVDFKNVISLEITNEEKRDHKGQITIHTYLLFKLKDNTIKLVPTNSDLMEAALPTILKTMENFDIHTPTGE